MKKVLFIAIVVVFGLGKLSAQGSNFGITAGFHNLSLKMDAGGMTGSESTQGFLLGLLLISLFLINGVYNLSYNLQLVRKREIQ